MMTTRQRTMNKQEVVYQALRERILDGMYSPGYRLVIDQLAKELGVSALPVREAIRRLEAEGFVVYQPSAGPRVAPADPSSFVDGMTVLAILEGYATAAASDALGPGDLAELRRINQEMSDCMATLDALRFSTLNRDFHARIVSHCSITYLIELISETTRRLDAIRRTVFTQIPFRASESIAEHESILSLIEAKAPFREIEAAAREHKLGTVESFRAWQHRNDLTDEQAQAALGG